MNLILAQFFITLLISAKCEDYVEGPDLEFGETVEGMLDDPWTVMKLNRSSCPPGTVPFYQRKLPRICSPKYPRSCPGKYSCYSDVNANVSICCGKIEGCAQGQPQLNILNNRPVMCLKKSNSNTTGQCQTPQFQCQEQRPASRIGICCPSSASISNRTITRMSGTNGRLIACEENATPVGSAPCLLNRPANCCNQSQGCLEGGIDPTYGKGCNCERNPACQREVPCCPSAPFSCPSSETALPDHPSCSTTSDCPPGSTCRKEDQDGICCIPLGHCPQGYIPSNRAIVFNVIPPGPTVCAVSNESAKCTAPAVCLRAVDSEHTHFLCCMPIPQCPYSHQSPYMEQDLPRTCSNSSINSSCPIDHDCLPSTLPLINICCTTTSTATSPSPVTGARNMQIWVPDNLTCPPKYEMQNGTVFTCDPRMPTSCNVGSRCLPSKQPGYFVCCRPMAPISKAVCTTETAFTWRPEYGPQVCDPNFASTGCPQTHPLCMFYPAISRHVCCRAPVCPNGNSPLWTPGTTVPRHCGPAESDGCPPGYLCLYSSLFEARICCMGRLNRYSQEAVYLGHRYSPNGAQEGSRGLSLTPWTRRYGEMRWGWSKKYKS